MKLVNLKALTASASNSSTVAQNKIQKEANLFCASNNSSFNSKTECNFFEGIEFLAENNSDSDDLFSSKINEPDLKFSKPEPKFNLDNAYLEIDNSAMDLSVSESKTSKLGSLLA